MIILGIDPGYKKRIVSIFQTASKLYESQGDYKSQVAALREKIYALTDKLKTEKICFEAK